MPLCFLRSLARSLASLGISFQHCLPLLDPAGYGDFSGRLPAARSTDRLPYVHIQLCPAWPPPPLVHGFVHFLPPAAAAAAARWVEPFRSLIPTEEATWRAGLRRATSATTRARATTARRRRRARRSLPSPLHSRHQVFQTSPPRSNLMQTVVPGSSVRSVGRAGAGGRAWHRLSVHSNGAGRTHRLLLYSFEAVPSVFRSLREASDLHLLQRASNVPP